jgi:hypothetical protein
MTWFLDHENGGYHLFFNRDEQKSRSRASLPEQAISDSGIDYLAPTDTEAGGTWIAVNQFGISLALLNHYEFQQLETYKDWNSRGEIIKRLIDIYDIHQIRSCFKSIDLKRYRAFRLFVMDVNGNNRLCVWDGRELSIQAKVTAPKTSSSVDAYNVKQQRRQLYYDSGLQNSTSIDDFYRYHASHFPDSLSNSVCMHREQGQTVSFTHIKVTGACAEVYYSDGAPCEHPVELRQTLELTSTPMSKLRTVVP